jgi:hypothetical protein
MSTGSTQGMDSAFIAWVMGARSSSVGLSASGTNSRKVASLIIIGVLTVVGWIELTRIMCRASSWARVRMSPTTPCLAET